MPLGCASLTNFVVSEGNTDSIVIDGMPNATLCGKAVVEMMLAEVEGIGLKTCEEQLVKSGNLPRSYLVSNERLERCKKMLSVQEQDDEGSLPSTRAGINL